MALAVLLQSLLEASGDKNDKAKGTEAEDTADTNLEDTTAEENTEDGSDTDEESGTDNDDSSDKGDEEETSEDENKDDESEENEEEKSDEENSEDDDFSLDPMEGEEEDDSGENPDGLVDPDDDGSSEMNEDDVETNIQTNILQLSKLDRTLAKRKCYNDFMDMRTTITSIKNIITENEVVIEPEVRIACLDKLEQLYSYVTDYIKFKFMITNYEENLQNYMIFLKSLNEIVVKIIPDSGNKRKSKKSQN